MKKSLLVMLAMGLSLNANALILNEGDSGTLKICRVSAWSNDVDGACAIFSTVVSLPTIIVEGQDLDLNSTDADGRLMAELDGAAQPVLLDVIAKDSGKSMEEVRAKAMNLKDLSVRSLVIEMHK